MSRVVERRPAPRRGFRGECCPDGITQAVWTTETRNEVERLKTLVAIRQRTPKDENSNLRDKFG